MYKVIVSDFDAVIHFLAFVQMLEQTGEYSSPMINRLFLWAAAAPSTPDCNFAIPVASIALAEKIGFTCQGMGAICTLSPISQEEYYWLRKGLGGTDDDAS